MDDGDRPEPPRGGRPNTLWAIAIALLVVSLLVTIFTPFKIFILFLPIGFAPLFVHWRGRR
jgi:hypothetical protein